MEQIERIYKIDQMLTSRGVVSTNMLLSELEISHSTLKRDIAYMRYRLHAPIRSDKDRGGYVFEKSETVGPKYALPGLWFSESELHALLTTQQLLQDVQPGLLTPHVKPLQEKIKTLLGSLHDDPTEIAKRVRIFAFGRRVMEPKDFQIIVNATIRRRQLKIWHYNRGDDMRTSRLVSPQQIVYYRDNWYVDCWCHLRQDIRSFSIDAIESAEMVAADAKTLPIHTVRDALGSGYGIFNGKSIQWAKLRIGSSRARWVSRTVWHCQQKSSFDAAGNYLLEIPYNDHRELTNDILSLLPDVEILAPATLRRHVLSVLEQGLNKIRSE